jgi:hypothetical protein
MFDDPSMTSEEVRKQILPAGAAPVKYARVSQLIRPAGPFGRAWLYEGITRGRFRSVVIRKSGCSRGLRLVDLESLNAFLEREAVKSSPDLSKDETETEVVTNCSH